MTKLTTPRADSGHCGQVFRLIADSDSDDRGQRLPSTASGAAIYPRTRRRTIGGWPQKPFAAWALAWSHDTFSCSILGSEAIGGGPSSLQFSAGHLRCIVEIGLKVVSRSGWRLTHCEHVGNFADRHRGEQNDLFAGTRDGHVEPPLTPRLPQNPEIPAKHPILVASESRAEHNDVSFVALYVFHVLNEKSNVLAICLAIGRSLSFTLVGLQESGIIRCSAFNCILDNIGLLAVEGHDTDGGTRVGVVDQMAAKTSTTFRASATLVWPS
jgi:hypothetical protein